MYRLRRIAACFLILWFSVGSAVAQVGETRDSGEELNSAVDEDDASSSDSTNGDEDEVERRCTELENKALEGRALTESEQSEYLPCIVRVLQDFLPAIVMSW